MRYLDVMQDSLDYIEENLKTELSAEELSRRAGFSKFHYCRLFQRLVGLSVKRYVVWRRLLWAAYAMAQGQKQVEAALEYGFDTSAGFYKAFRRMFGYSPSNYVKRFKVARPYSIDLTKERYNMIEHSRVKEVLKQWALTAENIANLVYSESGAINPNAFVINERYVLKAFSVLGKAQINVQIQKALCAKGLQEAVPVTTEQGEEIVGDGEFFYLLMPKIDGESLRAAEFYEGDSYAKAYELGKVIGKLHQVLKESDDIPCNERNIYEEVCKKWLEPAMQALGLNEAFKWDYVDNFGQLQEQLSVQIIHRDPNPSNILWKEGNCAGFIDFDLAQRSIRLFDPCYAATAILSESFDQPNETWFEIFKGIIHGYDSVALLTEAEKKAIPYVVLSIQLICVGYFSQQEKFEQLAKTNVAMMKWLLENREKLEWD